MTPSSYQLVFRVCVLVLALGLFGCAGPARKEASKKYRRPLVVELSPIKLDNDLLRFEKGRKTAETLDYRLQRAMKQRQKLKVLLGSVRKPATKDGGIDAQIRTEAYVQKFLSEKGKKKKSFVISITAEIRSPYLTHSIYLQEKNFIANQRKLISKLSLEIEKIVSTEIRQAKKIALKRKVQKASSKTPVRKNSTKKKSK